MNYHTQPMEATPSADTNKPIGSEQLRELLRKDFAPFA